MLSSSASRPTANLGADDPSTSPAPDPAAGPGTSSRITKPNVNVKYPLLLTMVLANMALYLAGRGALMQTIKQEQALEPKNVHAAGASATDPAAQASSPSADPPTFFKLPHPQNEITAEKDSKVVSATFLSFIIDPFLTYLKGNLRSKVHHEPQLAALIQSQGGTCSDDGSVEVWMIVQEVCRQAGLHGAVMDLVDAGVWEALLRELLVLTFVYIGREKVVEFGPYRARVAAAMESIDETAIRMLQVNWADEYKPVVIQANDASAQQVPEMHSSSPSSSSFSSDATNEAVPNNPDRDVAHNAADSDISAILAALDQLLLDLTPMTPAELAMIEEVMASHPICNRSISPIGRQVLALIAGAVQPPPEEPPTPHLPNSLVIPEPSSDQQLNLVSIASDDSLGLDMDDFVVSESTENKFENSTNFDEPGVAGATDPADAPDSSMVLVTPTGSESPSKDALDEESRRDIRPSESSVTDPMDDFAAAIQLALASGTGEDMGGLSDSDSEYEALVKQAARVLDQVAIPVATARVPGTAQRVQSLSARLDFDGQECDTSSSDSEDDGRLHAAT